MTRTPFLCGTIRAVGVTVSLFVAVFVIVSPWAMRVPVPSKNSKASQVRSKSEAADNQDELSISNLGGVDKSRERFEDDGYAKRDEEDGVEEGTEDLGAEPLRGAVSASIFQM